MENSGAMIFVKNVNFGTTDESLKELFEKKIGKVVECSISKRLERGKYLSMGYGWVKMASPDLASKAVKTIQGIELDGHRINLKISKKEEEKLNNRQEAKNQDQPEGSCKIMVRNVPFQCQGISHALYLKVNLLLLFLLSFIARNKFYYKNNLNDPSSGIGAAFFHFWRAEIRANAKKSDWQTSRIRFCRVQTCSRCEFSFQGVETVDSHLWKVREGFVLALSWAHSCGSLV